MRVINKWIQIATTQRLYYFTYFRDDVILNAKRNLGGSL